jgi:putative ABC transport system permease protein
MMKTGGPRERALLRENVKLALTALWQSKLRTSLTLLGIVIGVATVIAMVSILSGLGQSVRNQIASLGSGILYVSKYEAGFHSSDEERNRKDLEVSDAEAIAELCPSVESVSPEINRPVYASAFGRRTSLINLNGVTEDFARVNEWEIAEGRFLTEHDVRHRSAVCVLGTKPAEVLFPQGGSLGQWVDVDGKSLQVIGVLAEKGNFLGQSMDDLVVAPLPVAAQKYGYGKSVDYITVRPVSPDHTEAAREEMIELLRRLRGVRADRPNDFGITSQENLLELYHRITGAVYLLTLVISSIGLLVGGIGVMNMMLVSVKERTREIGLRAALGARRRDILGQFLIEAVALTGTGGIIGMAIGFALAGIVRLTAGVQMAVTPLGIGVALLLSVGVGIFFGIYPAHRASRLDPIEALRHE